MVSHFSMDFVEELPRSHRHDMILEVVDRLTKCVHLIAMSHPYAVAKVGALYVQHMFKLHGLPSSIVSDIDPVFTVAFWEELIEAAMCVT